MRFTFALLSVFCFALVAQAAPAPRLVDEHYTRMKIQVMRPEPQTADEADKQAVICRSNVTREDHL